MRLTSVGPLGAALLLAASCTGVRPQATEAASPSALVVWVDVAAQDGGDGTEARPFRRLEEALAAPAPRRLVHLAAGLYPGPFVAPDGTELLGASAAVLTAKAGVTVLEAEGALTLRRILLQGGTLGLRGTGEVRLEDVRFSGQRAGALLIGQGGHLLAHGVVFEASVSNAVGVHVEAEAQAELLGCTFEGPWQRGVEALAPGRLVLATVAFRGAVTAVHLRGGVAELSDVSVSEGRGPGLYVAGGRVSLRRVQVHGHEYGLLTGTGAVVEAEDFTSTGADRAGVGVVQAKAHFTKLTVLQAGTFGGLQAVSSEVAVEGLLVEDTAGLGISTRDGSLRLDGARVLRTRDRDGSGADGVQLRGGTATFRNLFVGEASGACLLAAEGADVTLVHATLEKCHTAGLVSETRAHLAASDVSVTDSEGPGAVAISDAVLVLRGFRAVGTEGVLWAECADGAQVTAADVAGPLPALPCIETVRLPR